MFSILRGAPVSLFLYCVLVSRSVSLLFLSPSLSRCTSQGFCLFVCFLFCSVLFLFVCFVGVFLCFFFSFFFPISSCTPFFLSFLCPLCCHSLFLPLACDSGAGEELQPFQGLPPFLLAAEPLFGKRTHGKSLNKVPHCCPGHFDSFCSFFVGQENRLGSGGDSGSDIIWGTQASLGEGAMLQWRIKRVGNEEGSCWVPSPRRDPKRPENSQGGVGVRY